MKMLTWDLETTGFSPRRDQIVEVGLVFSDGFSVTKEAGCLVKPTIEIPIGAIRVHGITNEKAQSEGFAWERVAERFQDALDSVDVWCGFNLGFDIGFAEAGLRSVGFEIPNKPVIDVFHVAQRFIPSADLLRKNLGNVCAHMGVPLNEAHRAVNDSVATLKALERICIELNINLESLLSNDEKLLGKYHLGEDPFEALYSGFVQRR